MTRRITWVLAGLLGALFLGLALIITPASAPAAQRPHQHLQAYTAPAVDMRPMSRARARLVAATTPTSYTARTGDTLWSVSAQFYGSGRLWPALWWVNRHAVRNPAVLLAGTRLHLSSWHPDSAALARRAAAAIPAPKPPQAAPAPAGVQTPAQPAAPAASAVTASAGAPGSFQACVIAAESGGNPSAVNPSSGAGGLYGFLPSTWAALGHSGLPENASVAEQNQAFAQEYAQAGTAPWAPYDGC